MVTGLGVGRLSYQCLIPDRISRFSLFHTSRPVYCLMFICGFFYGREAEQVFVCIVAIKIVWKYTRIAPYVFLARCLIKHRDNFIFVIS
jgi:uncharacterized membrane protein